MLKLKIKSKRGKQKLQNNFFTFFGNKKGMAINFIVQMVIVILAFVLISMVVAKFMAGAQDRQAEIICHDSVALRAATVIQFGKAKLTTTPLLCKTIDKKISGDREEVLMEVSDAMARCWWMYNEGLYDDQLGKMGGLKTFHEVFNIAGNKNKCNICYSLAIDSDDLEDNPITTKELMAYVRDNEYSKGKTYLEYIQSGGGPGHIMILDGIENGKSYGTTFLSRNTNKDAQWGWVGYVVGGLAVAGIFACVIAEPCGAILGTSTLVAAGTVGAGAAAFSTYNNVQTFKAKYVYGNKKERSVSIVAFDNLNDVQAAECYEGDVAGK